MPVINRGIAAAEQRIEGERNLTLRNSLDSDDEIGRSFNRRMDYATAWKPSAAATQTSHPAQYRSEPAGELRDTIGCLRVA